MRLRLAVATVAAVVLAACGAPTQQAQPAGGPQPSSSATSNGAVTAALDWREPLVGGGQLAGGDLQGRDVVLWFWAPW